MTKFNLKIQPILYFLILSFSIAFSQTNSEIELDTFKLFDKTRNREIPIAVYTQKNQKIDYKQNIVIFSHGYGQNKGGDYLAYSYLTNKLAENGYFVVSIQHELSTDSLLPLTGIPQIVRRPFWDRGAENINFVIAELRQKYPKLNFKQITLIGHSNGGDMTALFPQKYPDIVAKIITLDNRRMALPKSLNLKTYSLRSSDQLPDEGVIPTDAELLKFNIKIIKLHNTIHNAMDDNGTTQQKDEINQYVLTFLKE